MAAGSDGNLELVRCPLVRKARFSFHSPEFTEQRGFTGPQPSALCFFCPSLRVTTSGLQAGKVSPSDPHSLTLPLSPSVLAPAVFVLNALNCARPQASLES